MEIHFKENNGPVDEGIDKLIEQVSDIRRPEIVREMILASLKAGQEDDGHVDLKLMNTSLKEMRFTAKAFQPYQHIRKVTVFGSARTKPDSTIYQMAYEFGKKLGELGYMVITGGGPGIMQAALEGAGPDYSFGVNIRLPFEQKPNPILQGNSKYISYKYFFNRKVAFLKESDAIALFPGGFGTMDEAMETSTLVQTGKRNPVPIILIDEPGGTYWTRWIEYIKDNLLAPGYISPSDLKLFSQVDSPDEAVERIHRFYFRYHSLRFVEKRLVIRLISELDEQKVERLKTDFSDILLPGGSMYRSGPLQQESDEPELSHLPRLIVDFKRTDFGRLKELIDSVNMDG
ncbi:MAG: TIGR00730 family Rossman fold protein [Deltaproteobacteria bacterium]|nr:TIGR00730 family Rossman fold protein [Deltaproteobacteria bacterium]